jgi:hypothetical protein
MYRKSHQSLARRDAGVGMIVNNHLNAGIDTKPAEQFTQRFRRRQRVATAVGEWLAGKVVMKMSVACARNMTLQISAPTGVRIHEIVAAVGNHPIRIAQPTRHFVDRNQGLKNCASHSLRRLIENQLESCRAIL